MDVQSRREAAFRRRVAAAQLARDRPHETSFSNGEEGRYRDPKTGRPSYTANFTKGLPHLPNGQIADPAHYIAFVRAIDSGLVSDIRRLPLGPVRRKKNGEPQWRSNIANEANAPVRAWESMGAGLVYSLEGPDSQSVSLPPAPTLDSCELQAEMAELYLMALLRDLPFSEWGSNKDPHPQIASSIELLNEMHWFQHSRKRCCAPTEAQQARRRTTVRVCNIFRGITPGVREGPYLSQFLLIGNQYLGSSNIDDILDGNVRWGAQAISQKDGADLRGMESYEPTNRFIATPRDLATYVHHDALYQAYLTACVTMLSSRVPFDPGLPFQEADDKDKQQGFAHFGGPHILTLVCEVATRALKAVRYQKFNVHRRLRPEAVAGLLDDHVRSVCESETVFPEVSFLADNLQAILCKVEAHNHEQNVKAQSCKCSQKSKANGEVKSSCKAKRSCKTSGNTYSHDHSDAKANGDTNTSRKYRGSSCTSYLLPMAYPEGSPMHPAYGAGHATVAGACVTILKAFFDSHHQLDDAYVPSEDGNDLVKVKLRKKLTVGHELNKLAENISIGRNWAGVHYFSDYIESMRMGEKIAIAILEEQKLLFGENFYMSIELFDGRTLRI